MKHTDTRVRYTKTILKDSLLNLLYKKPIEKISVKELCEKAEINRSTFYLHYCSVDDILLEIETQYFEECKKFFILSSSNETEKDTLINMLKLIQTNRKLAITLSKTRNDYAEKIKSITEELVIKRLKIKHPEYNQKQLEIIFDFFLFGAMRVILLWLEEKIDYDAYELADFLISLEEMNCNSLKQSDLTNQNNNL